MTDTNDAKSTLDVFEAILVSVEITYPAVCFATPDKEFEGYLRAFRESRKASDFEGLRANAKAIYGFLEERIPIGKRRDFYLESLEASCKKIFELLPPVNLV